MKVLKCGCRKYESGMVKLCDEHAKIRKEHDRTVWRKIVDRIINNKGLKR